MGKEEEGRGGPLDLDLQLLSLHASAISLKSGEEGYRVDMSLLRSASQPDFLPLRILLCSCYGVRVCVGGRWCVKEGRRRGGKKEGAFF